MSVNLWNNISGASQFNWYSILATLNSKLWIIVQSWTFYKKQISSLKSKKWPRELGTSLLSHLPYFSLVWIHVFPHVARGNLFPTDGAFWHFSKVMATSEMFLEILLMHVGFWTTFDPALVWSHLKYTQKSVAWVLEINILHRKYNNHKHINIVSMKTILLDYAIG